MANHTQGKIEARAKIIDGDVSTYYLTLEDGRTRLAKVAGSSSMEKNRRNAARLALCWNSHDELVRFAEKVSEMYPGNDHEGNAARALLDRIEKETS